MRSTLLLFFVVVAAVALYRVGTDPYRTRLPLNVDDLSVIEPQLSKLPAEDRVLVVEYLKRSNGDVLPAQFADPDEPFTARTFAEAIELQKAYRVKFAADMKRQAERQAERDAAMKPLRAAISLRLIKRELLTKDEIYGVPVAQSGPKVGRNRDEENRRIQIMTYRLTNQTNRTIAAFEGTAEIPGESLMPAASCWISERTPLSGFDSRDIRCGNVNRPANQEERDAVTRPVSELVLKWFPTLVRFDDGETLKASRY